MEAVTKTFTPNQQNAQPRQREKWPDIARGLCAMFVILSHVSYVPTAYSLFYAPFMIPLFFLVSGYLTNNYVGNVPAFFYNKVLKEVILKGMVVLSITTLSITTVIGFFLHPSTIPDWLLENLNIMFFKPRAVFFSMLVLCSVYFIIINKLCRNRPLPMLMVGTTLAVVGVAVSVPGILRPWGWDTALVCELFYLIGYCARQKNLPARFRFQAWHGIVSGGIFIAAVLMCTAFFGAEKISIIVVNNTWAFLPTTILLMLTGNAFVIILSHLLPEKFRIVRLLMYIGRHSLIYFMFGGPILAYLSYFVNLLYSATDWEILQNHYVMSLAVWLSACLLTLIPCLLSDKFCPALNGSFKLPQKYAPQYHKKAWIAACASAAAVMIGLGTAYLNGVLIPNKVYARKYGVYGVDVSSYQGKIDWQTLAAQDIQFVFIKATEGSGSVDAKFADNWNHASETDLAVGAYHFFSYDSPGSTQAENFIAAVPVRENSLPPVVDIEFYGDKERRLPEKEDVRRELQVLLDALEAHYSRKPIIYATEKSYLLYIIDEFDDYDVWTRNVVTDPYVKGWTFWQYTDRARLDGYEGEEQFIDMNVFAGTPQEFAAYVAG